MLNYRELPPPSQPHSALASHCDFCSGITVDGRLMWAPPEVGHEDQERTYFDQIVVSRGGPEAVVVTLTLDSVNISQPGRPDRTLLTGAVGSVRGPDLQVSIDEQFRCWVELGQGVSFLVLFHHYQHPDYMQLDHLGFYIAKGDGLSVGTQGLLGGEIFTLSALAMADYSLHL